jgi:phosphoesterase RecJ-like protein
MIPEAVLAALAPRPGARRILLSSHQNPDGDAIGSELGLARILRDAGREVAIWNYHATPPVYRHIPGAIEIHAGTAPPAGFPEAFDLAIVLECPTLDRTGLEAELARLPIVNIDHHLGNPGYGIAHWVDVDAPAVAVMFAELAGRMGWAVDPLAASCLLVGLTTDTGGYRFSNTTPRAHAAAAAMIESGASPELVSKWVYESQSEGSVRLLGRMLATLEIAGEGRVASVYVTREMFRAAGAEAGDSENLIDVPRGIAGVDAVVLLREIATGEWKISLRSRGAVDVQSIARRHAGGGHFNAAGCKATGDLEKVRALFVGEMTAALEASFGH